MEVIASSAAADGSTQQRSHEVRPDTMNNPATASITAAAESLERYPRRRGTKNALQMLDYSGWAIISDCSVNTAAESADDCDSCNLCIGESR